MKLSSVSKLVLAILLGLVVVFVIEPLDPSTLSTPFCLGLILMALSLRQGTFLVTAVSLVYTGFTVFATIQFHDHYVVQVHASPHPYFWLFQRTGLFVVLCGLAIYLAHYRTSTEQILSRFQAILGKLPSPVLLSDAAGNIIYANEALSFVLRQPASEITGKSYFNFFLKEKMKGEFIRSYFELFEQDTNGHYELEIRPFGHANRVNAYLTNLGTEPNRVLITVLQVREEPDQSASHEASHPTDHSHH